MEHFDYSGVSPQFRYFLFFFASYVASYSNGTYFRNLNFQHISTFRGSEEAFIPISRRSMIVCVLRCVRTFVIIFLSIMREQNVISTALWCRSERITGYRIRKEFHDNRSSFFYNYSLCCEVSCVNHRVELLKTNKNFNNRRYMIFACIIKSIAQFEQTVHAISFQCNFNRRDHTSN